VESYRNAYCLARNGVIMLNCIQSLMKGENINYAMILKTKHTEKNDEC